MDSSRDWKLPFTLVEDKSTVINQSLKTLNGINYKKISFSNSDIDENFCANENLYAVVFDTNKNNPLMTLSILGDKVLGVSSCMGNDDSKYFISGTEDKNELVRTYLVAFVYAKFEEIKQTFCNFIDELKFLPLDIETLLGISLKKSANQIDSLKELADKTKDLNINSIYEEVDIAIESVEVDTLQYAQLQRFLDIAGLIDDSDASKLRSFFSNLYKGQVYLTDKVTLTQELTMDNVLKSTIIGMLSQQKKALENVQTEDDIRKIIYKIESLRKYFPNMPKDISSKKLMQEFLNTQLATEDKNIIPVSYEGNVITFVSKIDKNELIPFRKFLQEMAGEEVHINFIDCSEIDFAIIQLILAYNKNYNVTYEFSRTKKLFQTILEGFDAENNSCNN